MKEQLQKLLEELKQGKEKVTYYKRITHDGTLWQRSYDRAVGECNALSFCIDKLTQILESQNENQ